MGERQLVPHLTIKGMRLDEFEVVVPQGLSNLINNAGAWGLKKENSNNEYDRRVKRIDGELVTILTKRS